MLNVPGKLGMTYVSGVHKRPSLSHPTEGSIHDPLTVEIKNEDSFTSLSFINKLKVKLMDVQIYLFFLIKYLQNEFCNLYFSQKMQSIISLIGGLILQSKFGCAKAVVPRLNWQTKAPLNKQKAKQNKL